LEVRDGRVTRHRGELKKVWSDELPPHPAVAERLAYYRHKLKDEIGPDLGKATARFIRRYNTESPLGSFVTDVMRERAGSDVAITNAGGLRADLPEGGLHRGHVLDALPFINSLVTLELTGNDLRRAIAHGLSLAAGCCQVSGIVARYDPQRPPEERLIELRVGDKLVEAERTYRVSTNSFLAEGGDRYESFLNGRRVAEDALLSDCVLDHLRRVGTITPPAAGRLVTI
ncbi:MAG: 5'-nucleotidase C-terminal domain-containing protein, partial [Thermoanaerobaculia bacterium]|nr:5'-nucleotidase C-terminal domain-containing protein [Thermoanaerobaculia bacterium]